MEVSYSFIPWSTALLFLFMFGTGWWTHHAWRRLKKTAVHQLAQGQKPDQEGLGSRVGISILIAVSFPPILAGVGMLETRMRSDGAVMHMTVPSAWGLNVFFLVLIFFSVWMIRWIRQQKSELNEAYTAAGFDSPYDQPPMPKEFAWVALFMAGVVALFGIAIAGLTFYNNHIELGPAISASQDAFQDLGFEVMSYMVAAVVFLLAGLIYRTAQKARAHHRQTASA